MDPTTCANPALPLYRIPKRTMMKPLRILSLGAGVQSSALFLMMAEGEIERADHAIFADTGWEPNEVYRWLNEVIMPVSETSGIPITIAQSKYGSVRERPWEMPLYTVGAEGNGMIRRQCTSKFKIDVVRREVRQLLALNGIDRPPAGAVHQVIGISMDEVQRMRDSDVKYITNVYPLIDNNLTRNDCQQWLINHGYGAAPKSACIGCPFHSNSEWLRLKQTNPEAFADAVRVDEGLRDGSIDAPGLTSVRAYATYLHPKRIPLKDITFKHEDQLDLFDQECTGMCGL